MRLIGAPLFWMSHCTMREGDLQDLAVYRINKGVLDVSDDKTLNDSMPDDSKRIPFPNMIYMGDGLSDVPCMKMMPSIRFRRPNPLASAQNSAGVIPRLGIKA